MRYCYSLVAIETKFNGEDKVVVVQENVMESRKETMAEADVEVAAGVKKMFDVTLAPVIDGVKVDGFWKAHVKTMDREIQVWMTRMKQIVRIG